jgi:hypothetical protein
VAIQLLSEATRLQLRIYTMLWSLETARTAALLIITRVLLSQTEQCHQTSVLVRMMMLTTMLSAQRPNTKKAVQLADQVLMPSIVLVVPFLESDSFWVVLEFLLSYAVIVIEGMRRSN